MQDVDYDFDSDEEWEEEPEDGEDLGDKDDADKEEDEKCSMGGGEEEDFDDEDDFLVPHGYLSDDEGGVGEYRDKDTLKTLEEDFYRDLKKEKIVREKTEKSSYNVRIIVRSFLIITPVWYSCLRMDSQ